MDFEALKQNILTSPAFIIDEGAINGALSKLTELCTTSGCKLLYSIKSLPLTSVLALTGRFTHGFSVSSLFEARLAAETLPHQGGIHLTTPGIRPDEVTELASLCSHISCNSLNQYWQFSENIQSSISLGLRVNPKLSFAQDIRHDACRQHSKLGIGTDVLLKEGIPINIKGLHFHTAYSATDYEPLIHTVSAVRRDFGSKLATLDWLNLGGGYLFAEINDNSRFIELVSGLITDFDLEIFIEPGNAIVGNAGYLLTTVIDCFDSDGKTIAVLDTSVNHHPQVFEYQKQPELVGHDINHRYSAILAGSTCLAGDLFGEYRFNQPISVGDKLVFKQVGAYSLVKANRFNGYNLPNIYQISANQIMRIKQYTYQDFRQLWQCDS